MNSTRRVIAAALVTAAAVTVPLLLDRPAESASASKVLVVVEENHSLAEARAQMPYLTGLGNTYAYATGWHATTHPSLPNYVAMTGGSTFGITTDTEPIPSPKIGTGGSVFGQTGSSRTYAESMTGTCSKTAANGYVPKHNPWVYYGSEATACKARDIPATSFVADAKANSLADVTFLIPNLSHDAHNGTLAAADTWLKGRLPAVLASADFTSGRLTVVVTFDEDDHSAGNQVLTVVMNADATRHGAVAASLNHYALTGYIDQTIGAPMLRGATAALAPAFGL
jgi:acid phosphatase